MIPQIEPWIDDEELRQVEKVVRSTYITEHSVTKEFECRLENLTGAKHVIAMANGTVALYAVLNVLGVGRGDEVIVPDMTFVATANSVILAGATPVFCDIRPDSLCIDVRKAEALITEKTKAIMPVHLYGLSADLDELRILCERHELFLVEDAAQGVGVKYRNRHVGTFGNAGVLSFYGNKTITTGEGGAVLTNDDGIAEECYKLKNHGRRTKGIFVHETVGYNFSFTDLQAAIGVAQLNKLERIIERKNEIRDYYIHSLEGCDAIDFQQVPEHTTPVFWFTNIRLDDAAALENYLKQEGIGSRRLFYPLHQQLCYKHLEKCDCPESTHAYEQWLSLPSGAPLAQEQLQRITAALEKFFKNRAGQRQDLQHSLYSQL